MKKLGTLNLLIVFFLCQSLIVNACTDPECSKCDTDIDICEACNDHYYVNADSCDGCPQNCLQCDSNIACKETGCDTGFQYLSTDSSCIKCADNCADCSVAGECTTCSTGYFSESATQCTKCGDNCDSCVDSTECKSDGCADGYHFVDAATPCALTCSDPQCTTCSPANVCTDCNTGYYVNADACSQCGANCDSCVDNTECKSDGCATGYHFVSGTKTCALTCTDPQCSTCSPANVCTDCTTGYYVNADACSKCGDNCDSCVDNTECKSDGCATDYQFLSTDKSCIKCADFCTTCSVAGECTDCNVGYFVDASNSNTCSKCGDNCDSCVDNTECKSDGCATGYHFVDATTPCALTCTDPQCTTCSPANVCSDCNPGYYVNGGSCSQCGDNCLECDDSNACKATGCADGYSFSLGACNIICADNCVSCSVPHECTTCDSRFYVDTLDNNKCSGCPANCLDCVDNTECKPTGCETDYQFYSTDKSCIKCADFCTTCSVAGECDDCNEGYFVDTSKSNICSECGDNCDSCVDNTECKSDGCATGYQFLSTDKSCIKCADDCTTCSVAGECDDCNVGYFVDTSKSNICSKCGDNCDSCVDNTECKSDGCATGYHFVSGTKTCALTCTDPQCSTCSPANVCSDCTTGYYVNADACSQCGANCDSCVDNTECKSDGCATGYHFVDATTPCALTCTDPQCTTCSPANVCTDCTTGYYVNADACSKCGDNCDSCVDNTECKSDGCATDYQFLSTDKSCIKCADYCTTCSVAGECTDCDEGYFVDTSKSNICSQCPANCLECDSTTACKSTGCDTGYQFLSADNSCIKCADYCTTCSVAGQCSDCNERYFVDTSKSNICSQCPDNCLECDSATECKSDGCDTGYHFVSGTKTCALTCTDPQCSTCSPANVCTDCNTGYYVNADACSQCGANCDSCVDNTECKSDGCATDYEFNAGVCDPICSGHCTTCSSPTDCTACEEYYFVDNKVCSECAVTYCKQCSTAPTCDTCDDGYFPNTATTPHTCDQCIDNCKTCPDSTICTTCKTGYYPDGSATPANSVCKGCSDHCDVCDATGCSDCAPKYFVDTDKTCKDCPANCLECDSDTVCKADGCATGYTFNAGACDINCADDCTSCTVVGECTVCNSLFAVNGEKTCTACPDHCSECEYSTTNARIQCKTDKCDTDYALNANGGCDPVCHAKCTTCDSPGVCSACDTNYYVNAGSCSQCGTNCDSCVDNTECKTDGCSAAYTYDADTKGCKITCMTGCDSCTTADACTTCSAYYFKDASSECQKCPDHCSECELDGTTNTLKCKTDKCDPNYTLNTDGGCDPTCAPNCKTCTTALTCDTCNDLFTVNDQNTCAACPGHCTECTYSATNARAECNTGKCETDYTLNANGGCDPNCSPNCQACTSPNTCDTCNESFFRSGTTCTACIANCKTCPDATTCTTCNTQYFPASANTVCTKCINNCDACSTSTTCSTCSSGYFIADAANPTVCTGCIANCKTCSDTTTCGACNTGYFVDAANGSVCGECPANCDTCDDKDNCQATGCADGYTESSGKCVPVCADNCATCTSPGTCDTCDSYFFVNTGKTCSACPDNCNTCTATGCTATGCDATYESKSGVCNPICSANCATCTTPGTCTTCNAKFWSSDATTCSNCPANCDTCTSGTACKTDGCSSGYQYTAASNTCTLVITCAPNCIGCETSGTCSMCKTNYILNPTTRKCEFYSDGSGSGSGSDPGITCSAHCTSCTSNTRCQACADGYALMNNACGTCSSGYYPQDSICKPCATGCAECVSDTECSKKSGNIGAIVGGIVGGAAAATIIIVILIKKKAILGLKAAFSGKEAAYRITHSRPHSPDYSYA